MGESKPGTENKERTYKEVSNLNRLLWNFICVHLFANIVGLRNCSNGHVLICAEPWCIPFNLSFNNVFARSFGQGEPKGTCTFNQR